MAPTWEIIEGDCRASLTGLDAGSVQTCVTSPPYFGLRDYGHDGQIGLEPTPDEFVAALVAVFRDVRRVLRDDGTVWLNLGDSYAGGGSGQQIGAHTGDIRNREAGPQGYVDKGRARPPVAGYKAKDLLGIPWMVAFALRADGWYLRSDIIWAKPNPMPESVTDRPTKAHEYLFLLSKQPRYFYDTDAIREAPSVAFHTDRQPRRPKANAYHVASGRDDGGVQEGHAGFGVDAAGRNKRSVWTVATQPFSGFDHRVRVERDAVGDDIQRTTSPSCPVHGGQTVPAPTARRGGRAGSPSRRSPDTYAGPDQGLLLDCAPTAPHPAPDSPAGSSDSLRHESPETETGRSSQSRRTDLAPVTTQPCTPSAGSETRTPGTSDQPASSAPHPDTIDRSIVEGDSGDPRASGTTDRTARRPSFSVDSACTCEFYRVERMDHFATFPPKLIEPCILAGCPERACSVCGAPWERIVEREAAARIEPQNAQMAREGHFRETRPVGQRGNAGMPNGQDMAATGTTRTVGFAPSCGHDAAALPGVVLDPFAGAGTTGMVALRHGRSFVGLELNPEYVRLARDRIIADSPLLNTYAERAA